MPNSPDPTRILSIQSHVVSGYVGNRAATFPLQLLGYDVDVINTVQFSNHTGYGHTNGHKTTPEDLAAVFSGLRTNGLLQHARILTGYVPGAQALSIVANEVEKMVGPGVTYLLDPVMGDIGVGLYVNQDVVPIYKSMLRLASIITPNQFEVELLSETKITSLSTLYTALCSLHSQGVPNVVLSSIALPISLVTSLGVPHPPASYSDLLPSPHPPWYDAVGVGSPDADVLVCFASYVDPKNSHSSDPVTYAFALPTVRGYFSGVGDLFSALVLGHYIDSSASPPSNDIRPDNSTNQGSLPPLAAAVSRALLGVQNILLSTHLHSLTVAASGEATSRALHEHEKPSKDSVIPSDPELDSAEPLNPSDPKRKARRMRLRELRIVQDRAKIPGLGEEGWPGVRVDWEFVRGKSKSA